MPSQTFYNLTPAKREALLTAARAEFARVPFREASINQIVHSAGISRGSFYMYFQGKEELLFYLLEDFCSACLQMAERHLEDSGGDLLSLPLALYDFMMEQCGEGEGMEFFRHTSEVVHWKIDCDSKGFLERVLPSQTMERLLRKINRAALSLEGPRDLRDLTAVLLFAALHAIAGGLSETEKRGEIRLRLENQIRILGRGAKASPERKAGRSLADDRETI
jgi:AcrR family transcriptional regulator